jgi:protein associated with RNAse G/E
VITEESVSFIDLDLDVYRSPDGDVTVYDRDEFEERRASYPPEFVDAAVRTTEEMVVALRSMAEPFGSTHRPFTDRLKIARPTS